MAGLVAAWIICAGVEGQAQRARAGRLPTIPLRQRADNAPAGRLEGGLPEIARARQIIGLYLRRGARQPHAGEQTTRLLRGRVHESQQIVKYAGPGRLRIEYLSPPALRGSILLLNGGRLFNYRPAENKILVGSAPLEEFQNRARELMKGVRDQRISVRVVGTQVVAGQSAAIVEIRAVRGGAFFKRFWIDEKTGVRLKNEDLDPQGNVISTSYFTKIDYAPVFDPQEFRPAALPNVPHEALLPPSPPLASVQEAQQRAGFSIREPSLPAGFHFNGAWVVPGPPGSQTVILRYTDGVNAFTLFQHPGRPHGGPLLRPGLKGALRPLLRNGVAHWVSDDRAFTLLGNLKPENARQIVDSLR